MSPDRRALVLLVEDNPADVNLVEEALAEAHVECGLQVLGDGAKAMQFIARVEKEGAPCPDLVMLDLNLPRLSGEQVLKRLRNSAAFAKVKVLIITSSNAASDREHAMQLGATEFFRKPSNIDQFLALGPKVRDMLEN